MTFTKKSAQKVISDYQALTELAAQYVNRDVRGHKVRIGDGGLVEIEVNDACNCHPEWIWEPVCTIDEVLEWAKEKEKLTTKKSVVG